MNLVEGIGKWIKTKFTYFTQDPNTIQYKFLIMGDKEIGKTSFLNRAINDQFSLDTKPSIDCQCENILLTIFDQKFNLFLIDVFTGLLSEEHTFLFEDVNGVFLLFDLTNRKSFEKIDNQIIDIRNNLGNDIPIILIGNKSDLKNLRVVHPIELEERAMLLNCDFLEVSCADEDSVNEAIKFLLFKTYYLQLPEIKKQYIKNIIGN